jgi:hypothetical protein
MDWFQRLTGFPERGYEETRALLTIEGEHLVSLANGSRHRIGQLELPSLAELRSQAGGAGFGQRLRVSIMQGDARRLHHDARFNGALFQVASQFNLLEMTGPEVTPEHGVTRYAGDPTQGPACAIAAGAATIYRNYFVPVDGALGQTRDRQVDALADVGQVLAARIGTARDQLYRMRNGYALPSLEGLQAIDAQLASSTPDEIDALRSRLRIGIHRDVEVTDAAGPVRPVVSQAFCSALPVSYARLGPAAPWPRFGRLVLEAAYEATLLAGMLNARRTGNRIVLLTRLGGGAFGNDGGWIDGAMERAFDLAAASGLDVRIVCRDAPGQAMVALAGRFGV